MHSPATRCRQQQGRVRGGRPVQRPVRLPQGWARAQWAPGGHPPGAHATSRHRPGPRGRQAPFRTSKDLPQNLPQALPQNLSQWGWQGAGCGAAGSGSGAGAGRQHAPRELGQPAAPTLGRQRHLCRGAQQGLPGDRAPSGVPPPAVPARAVGWREHAPAHTPAARGGRGGRAVDWATGGAAHRRHSEAERVRVGRGGWLVAGACWKLLRGVGGGEGGWTSSLTLDVGWACWPDCGAYVWGRSPPCSDWFPVFKFVWTVELLRKPLLFL